MREQLRAIERVADKRHSSLCNVMPEAEAAKKVALWLHSLYVKHSKHWEEDEQEFIKMLISAYEA